MQGTAQILGAVLVLTASAAAQPADTWLWDAPAGGDFNDPGNWLWQADGFLNDPAPPGPDDEALFDTPDAFVVGYDTNVSTELLTVDAGQPILSLSGHRHTIASPFRQGLLVSNGRLVLSGGVLEAAQPEVDPGSGGGFARLDVGLGATLIAQELRIFNGGRVRILEGGRYQPDTIDDSSIMVTDDARFTIDGGTFVPPQSLFTRLGDDPSGHYSFLRGTVEFSGVVDVSRLEPLLGGGVSQLGPEQKVDMLGLDVDSDLVLGGGHLRVDGSLRVDRGVSFRFDSGILELPEATFRIDDTTADANTPTVFDSDNITIDGGRHYRVRDAEIPFASVLTLADGNSVEASERFVNDGAVILDGSNARLQDRGAPALAGSENTGLIEGSGQVITTRPLVNTGRIQNVDGAAGPTFTDVTNRGIIDVTAGSLRFVRGAPDAGGVERGTGVLLNESAGLIDLDAAELHFEGLDNRGGIDVLNRESSLYGTVVNRSEGVFRVLDRGTLASFDPFVNEGAVFVERNATAVFFGDVFGDGEFLGEGEKLFLDTVRPGTSPGRMDLAGPVTLGAATALILEIGPQGSDLFAVDGELNAGGRLEVHLLNGFLPAAGDTFVLLEADEIVGTFESVLLPQLPPELTAEPLLTDTGFSVRFVPEPMTLILVAVGGLAAVFRRRPAASASARSRAAKTA